MKKVILILCLASATLFASEATTTRQEQIKTMQNLEVSMSTIQKGFLYNNTTFVKQGIASLKDNLKNIKDFDIKNDENKTFDAKKYSTTELKAIGILADQILIDFDKGNKEVVLKGFQNMLNRCITCHLLVRNW